MPATGKMLMLPVLLTASLAASAGAQQGECKVNEGSPSPVAKALLSVSMAQNAQAGGQRGYATNPDQPIDVIAAIDTAFSAVEVSDPNCLAQTSPWRAQKPWVTM